VVPVMYILISGKMREIPQLPDADEQMITV
jgi:hypothetical protein